MNDNISSQNFNDCTVQIFSKGKVAERNEDSYGSNDTTFVVCDGVSSKAGGVYDGKTGGEIASPAAVEAALGSNLNGVALINHVSKHLLDVRRQYNMASDDVECGTTFVCARIENDTLFVTQVGDTSFRINGEQAYDNPQLMDELTAGLRAKYIALTGDIAGGRDYIMPLLKVQAQYLNNPDSPLGCGIINGETVPEKFIKSYSFELSAVQTLELSSDGYYALPDEPTIEAYEALHAEINRQDPDKYLHYPATKPADDRTVMIVSFNKTK